MTTPRDVKVQMLGVRGVTLKNGNVFKVNAGERADATNEGSPDRSPILRPQIRGPRLTSGEGRKVVRGQLGNSLAQVLFSATPSTLYRLFITNSPGLRSDPTPRRKAGGRASIVGGTIRLNVTIKSTLNKSDLRGNSRITLNLDHVLNGLIKPVMNRLRRQRRA
jgi:hypothetical protein